MDRPRFDAFCARHHLDPAAIDLALSLSGQRPDGAAWRAQALTLLRAAGLGALGAGALFFVAANWQDYGVVGRFALLQGALLGGVAGALWRPPPQPLGQAALLLATLLAGGLLALFGQSYQTGADVHELFFTWSLLALPFVLAAASGALWALWWGVLNVGLALLCGWIGPEHFFWRVVTGWGLDRSGLLMLPCLINLLAAWGFDALHDTRWRAMAPEWLARFLAAFGILYGSAASMLVVAGAGWDRNDARARMVGVAVVLGFAAICAALGVVAWRRRRDVFPLTLLAASWIAISTVWLARWMRLGDIGAFFTIALWLIGTSTSAGMLLMHWWRRWRTEQAPPPAGAPS